MKGKEKITMDIKGYVKATALYSDGTKEILHEGPNALTAGAKEIVALLLGGEVNPLNQMEVFKAAGSLATAGMNTVAYPTTDSVEFTAVFDELSFNDTLDEIRLQSTVEGDFSIITGLSVLKTDSYQLAVEWTLTINAL